MIESDNNLIVIAIKFVNCMIDNERRNKAL